MVLLGTTYIGGFVLQRSCRISSLFDAICSCFEYFNLIHELNRISTSVVCCTARVIALLVERLSMRLGAYA